MKNSVKMLIAFLLNLFFAVFEFIGGIFTGSVAILSDSLHDFGDSLSIGISLFLEKKSQKPADDKNTFGYRRYSVLGGAITTIILVIGSVLMVIKAIERIITPTPINYNVMIIFAVIGVIINFIATFITHGGRSANQKAVNLHMLEDVLGWMVVLIGAIVMRFTDFALIDSVMTIGVSLFIIYNAFKNLINIVNIFLDKKPKDVNIEELAEHLTELDGVKDVHHIHVWSIDGENNLATLHIVADGNPSEIKSKVKEELKEHGVIHATVEIETEQERCKDRSCSLGKPILATECHCGQHHH